MSTEMLKSGWKMGNMQACPDELMMKKRPMTDLDGKRIKLNRFGLIWKRIRGIFNGK